jgi:hypothetical protein
MEPYIYIVLFCTFAGGVAGAAIFFILNKFLFSLKMSRRVEMAHFSEEEAEALLKKKGFKIVGRHVRTDIVTYIDGRPNLGYVVADFIVEKNKKRYVAEVKAGELVSDPTEPSTRRQLLEYKFAYKPDGLLLVDMLDRAIHLVEFENPKYADDRIFKLILGTLVVIIAACVLWISISIKIL